jgi:hypothetical protein
MGLGIQALGSLLIATHGKLLLLMSWQAYRVALWETRYADGQAQRIYADHKGDDCSNSKLTNVCVALRKTISQAHRKS